jgi:hypothetical protein
VDNPGDEITDAVAQLRWSSPVWPPLLLDAPAMAQTSLLGLLATRLSYVLVPIDELTDSPRSFAGDDSFSHSAYPITASPVVLQT